MVFTQPFYRIGRPMLKNSSSSCKYVLDNRYADDRSMLCRSYKILESDLKRLLNMLSQAMII